MYTKDQIAAATLKDATWMIRENMAESTKWLIRGLLAIYARQTADEQNIEQTELHNGVGFGAFDANLLTSFAKKVQEWDRTPAHQRRYDRPLSDKQLEILKKRMPKYAGQLASLVHSKTSEPVAA